MLIGEDGRASFDIGIDGRLDVLDTRALDGHSDRVPATFPHSQHGGFANSSATTVELFVLVFIDLSAANVGLIDLYHPAQFVYVGSAGFAEPLQHEPS